MKPVPLERTGDLGQAVLSPLFAPLEGSGRGAGHCGQKEATCPDLVKRSVEGGRNEKAGIGEMRKTCDYRK